MSDKGLISITYKEWLNSLKTITQLKYEQNL